MWNCASILGFGTFRTPTLKAFLLVAIAATTGLSAGQENPRNISHSHRSSGNSEFQEAEALIEKGEFAQAAAIIQRQLEQNPTSVEGYNLLGIAYTDAKDFTRANEAFQQALKLAPNSARTHNNLGNLYVAQNKLDLAEKEFKSVLSTAPTNRDANYNMGLLLMAKGMPIPAIPHFQRVQPQNVETRFNLVRAYLQADKTAEALQQRAHFPPRTSPTSNCISRSAFCWLVQSNTSRRNWNWNRPTP